MTVTTVRELGKHVGQEVELRGWVYNSRNKGKLVFLLLRDGSGTVQCVAFKNDFDEALFEEIKTLTQESAVKVRGTVRADVRAPGGYELSMTGAEVVSLAKDYPITPKEHGEAFLLDNRHLWIRSKLQHATLRIRAGVVKAVRDYLDGNGYILADSPILTSNACEGTTTLFETQYFEHKAYLSQSGQLYNEATAAAFGKSYCFGPTFRAERSKTRRHLIEFWMVEPEIAFCSLDELMDICEDFLFYVLQYVLMNHREDLITLERPLEPLEAITRPFPRMSYEEAARRLREAGIPFEEGNDFGAPDEEFLSKLNPAPLLVHRYPKEVKAFYMKTDPKDPRYALCLDVLAPEGYGEVIGGGQREDDYDTLVGKIKAHELPLEAFDWYLDLRKYGTMPHSGFGMGIERCVTWLCGIHHVRETIPFPRMLYRMKP